MNNSPFASGAEPAREPSSSATVTTCPHQATTLCHGTLRWACDDCGAVSYRTTAERRIQLEARLSLVQRFDGSYNRRHDVA